MSSSLCPYSLTDFFYQPTPRQILPSLLSLLPYTPTPCCSCLRSALIAWFTLPSPYRNAACPAASTRTLMMYKRRLQEPTSSVTRTDDRRVLLASTHQEPPRSWYYCCCCWYCCYSCSLARQTPQESFEQRLLFDDRHSPNNIFITGFFFFINRAQY